MSSTSVAFCPTISGLFSTSSIDSIAQSIHHTLVSPIPYLFYPFFLQPAKLAVLSSWPTPRSASSMKMPARHLPSRRTCKSVAVRHDKWSCRNCCGRARLLKTLLLISFRFRMHFFNVNSKLFELGHHSDCVMFVCYICMVSAWSQLLRVQFS